MTTCDGCGKTLKENVCLNFYQLRISTFGVSIWFRRGIHRLRGVFRSSLQFEKRRHAREGDSSRRFFPVFPQSSTASHISFSRFSSLFDVEEMASSCSEWLGIPKATRPSNPFIVIGSLGAMLPLSPVALSPPEIKWLDMMGSII